MSTRIYRGIVASFLLSVSGLFSQFAIAADRVTYDLQSDYSTNQNPAGVWSYGWKSAVDSRLTLLPYSLIQNYGGGEIVHRWLETGAGGVPAVQKNIGSANHISDGGQGNIPPGGVWYHAGPDGTSENFGAIRFTVPPGKGGTYRLESAVRTYLDGPLSGDCDFHVVKNGIELFGQFMPGTSAAGYSNAISLAEGDTVDFLVGRGQDNRSYASGLKIRATLSLVDTPIDCVPIPAGLVAWWPLEGNAEDVAGSNDGTLLGAPAFAAGKVGQAMQFDYVNDAVRIPANPTLNVGAGAGFTLEAWIKPNDLSVQHPMVEWNNDQGGIGTHFWTTVRDFDGQIKSLYANILDANGGAHVIFSPPNLLTTTQFYHVALTYDKASGGAALYINGNSVTQKNLGTFTPQTSSHLYLGYRSSGTAAGNRFSGLMDEVSLYNRALSPGEIAAVFGADSAGKCHSEANTPPVARILLEPQVTFSPEQPHPFVIAANGSDAVIRLDASGSTDADNDPLTYAWRMAGDSNPFSVQPVTVNTVPIGTHTVELVVSDGQASGTASITFEVISASEAVAEISRLLTQAGLSKKIEYPLQASLRAAMKSLEQQHLTPAVGQLKAFQQKLRASVLQLDPALAQTLTAAATMVIDALAP